MKKSRLSLIIVGIVVLCFDLLSLILRNDFNSNFWFGFGFVQFSFILYLIFQIMITENDEAQRGIKPISFITVSNIAVMMIMAFILYALPNIENIRIIVIPYVIFTALIVIGIMLGIYYKKIINYEKQSNVIVLNKEDCIRELKKSRYSITNMRLAEEVDLIISKLENCELNENNPRLNSFYENVLFLCDEIRRGLTENMLFHISNLNKIIDELKR